MTSFFERPNKRIKAEIKYDDDGDGEHDEAENNDVTTRGGVPSGPSAINTYSDTNAARIDTFLNQKKSSSSNSKSNQSNIKQKLKVTEVLAEKLSQEVRRQQQSLQAQQDDSTSKSSVNAHIHVHSTDNSNSLARISGDIPALALRYEYFMGIPVGWPFPVMLKPQRLMALHIIKALSSSQHVVLESPTGTGKSAAILCSALAWQRHQMHVQQQQQQQQQQAGAFADASQPVKIIYCSRTHSQVAQMVSSLLKTPYRPNMTVLGSRERLCIHAHLPLASATTNTNHECRTRVREVESIRRRRTNGIGDGTTTTTTTTSAHASIRMSNATATMLDDHPVSWMETDDLVRADTVDGKDRKPTCPHYRQLTADRTAASLVQNFRSKSHGGCSSGSSSSSSSSSCGKSTCGSGTNNSNCDSGTNNNSSNNNNNTSSTLVVGGDETTKDGVHDIEDLVEFGKNPYKRTVVLRKKDHEEWGLALYMDSTDDDDSSNTTAATHPSNNAPGENENAPGAVAYPRIQRILAGGGAARSDTIHVGDWIFSMNGQSTAHCTLSELANTCRACTEKLVLQIGTRPDEIHPHSVCPYYASRALEKHAELVFCPYNYILDPSIRQALGIGLEGTVVVLDEAHNVEDTLRGSGSGKWSEFDLCQIIQALEPIAGDGRDHYSTATSGYHSHHNEKEDDVRKVAAHEILVFLEKIVLHMIDRKHIFEDKGGATKALEEWKRFHTADNKSFETSYDGPTGYGVKNRLAGCSTFFDKIRVGSGKALKLSEYAGILNEFVQQNEDKRTFHERNLFDSMADLVNKMTLAMEHPADYFVQASVQPNGSFAYAGGEELVRERPGYRKPKKLPSSSKPQPCGYCRRIKCGHSMVFYENAVHHGSYNTGSAPKWESFITLELLSPARFMSSLVGQCRTVILASGSLAPLPSLCAELGLRAASSDKPSAISGNCSSLTDVGASSKSSQSTPDGVPGKAAAAAVKPAPKVEPRSSQTPEGGPKKSNTQKEPRYPDKLQVKPPPLEADHVIDLEKQLLAVAIGNFPTGEKLTVSYSQYKHDAFIDKLGDAVATAIECIPTGGVLVFLPSYSLLRKCSRAWNPESSYERFPAFDAARRRTNTTTTTSTTNSNVWERLQRSKGKVIVEPTGTQSEFEAARDEYAEAIASTGSCILLAVFRGKMSEGISFNDANARGVICIGIPYPNAFDRSITAKKRYNDEQRKLGKRLDILDGDSWYSQQAFRAIAQALGRCIRHAGDYGTIILMDSRHCDDSPPDANGVCRAHRNLPKWMRSHMKSLTPKIVHDYGSNSKLIGGGWDGLKTTMRSFFEEAPPHCEKVLRLQREMLLAAQKRAAEAREKKPVERKPDTVLSASAATSNSNIAVTVGSANEGLKGDQPNAPPGSSSVNGNTQVSTASSASKDPTVDADDHPDQVQSINPYLSPSASGRCSTITPSQTLSAKSTCSAANGDTLSVSSATPRAKQEPA